jgi:hypothetical protein
MTSFIQKIAFLLFLIVGLNSCSKEVKIDIPGFAEQIVIDGSIETGTPAIIFLSNSKDIYAPTDINSYLSGFISGATVIVSDGTITDTLMEICTDNLPLGFDSFAEELFGIPIDSLVNLHLCAYASINLSPLEFVIKGEVGKTYSLKVIHENKTYTSSTKIQNPKVLDNLFWKEQANLPGYGFSWAKLTDDPVIGDAYRWEVKKDGESSFSKPFQPYYDDRFVNGLTFEFSVENPMSFKDQTIEDQYKGYYKLGDTIVVKFSKLGKKEYQFFEKKYNQIYSGGNPFATPTNIPTNIEGGALGVWAGFSPWYDTLICVP